MANVGAIILAAGGSSRFGRSKQLLPFQGATLVRRAVEAGDRGGCAPVVVVVGETGDDIKAELRDTSAEIVENSEWRQGLGTSIHRGLQHLVALAPDLDAVLLLACDQPFVEQSIVTALIAEHEQSGKPIVASSYADTLGIPALFHRSCFQSLRNLAAECGAKSLIESRPNDVAQIEFSRGAIDIDTPADYERFTTPP